MSFIELKDDEGAWQTLSTEGVIRVTLHDNTKFRSGIDDDKKTYLNITAETRRSDLMSFSGGSRIEHSTYSLTYHTRERAEEAYNAVRFAMGLDTLEPA